MKNLVLSFLFIALTSCGQASAPSPETSEKIEAVKIVESNTEIRLKVEGMVCAVGCAGVIQEAIAAAEGVGECRVDFEQGRALVAYDSLQTSSAEIISVIEELADGQYSASHI